MVLERAGDDLRGRRRAAVHEHDERDVVAEMLARRPERLWRSAPRTNAGDLLTVLEEQARCLERLFDDAAAIVAHVEHDSLRALRNELLDGLLHFFGCVL